MLCDLLDQLLGHILRVELGQEQEVGRTAPRDIRLLHHLIEKKKLNMGINRLINVDGGGQIVPYQQLVCYVEHIVESNIYNLYVHSFTIFSPEYR